MHAQLLKGLQENNMTTGEHACNVFKFNVLLSCPHWKMRVIKCSAQVPSPAPSSVSGKPASKYGRAASVVRRPLAALLTQPNPFAKTPSYSGRTLLSISKAQGESCQIVRKRSSGTWYKKLGQMLSNDVEKVAFQLTEQARGPC